MADRTRNRILIVDDDPTIVDIIRTVLLGKGYHCDSAPDGIEALRLCEENVYDAVISDVVMPGMNGLQLTRELTKRNIDAPIMVMTGYGGENAAAEAIEAGASEFIEKPFSLAAFDLRFQKMVQQHEILRMNREKQSEFQKISSSMIAGIEKDAYENLARLQKELDALRTKKG